MCRWVQAKIEVEIDIKIKVKVSFTVQMKATSGADRDQRSFGAQ
jgi:hypothetical protein